MIWREYQLTYKEPFSFPLFANTPEPISIDTPIKAILFGGARLLPLAPPAPLTKRQRRRHRGK